VPGTLRTLPPPPPGGWEALADGNEARVYESLVLNAGLPGFAASREGAGGGEGSAVLLRSSAVPSALVVNRVLGLGAGEPLDEARLDRFLACYGDAGFGIEIGAALCTPGVLAWLKGRRFRRLAQSQMMACETARAQVAGRYDKWAQQSGLRIERVGPEQGAVVSALCCENFKVPAAVGELVRAGPSGPGWRRWLAFDGELPVGASLSHVGEGIGWCGWTSVSPSHRGRWIHAGFVARQFDDAFEAGCRWITTDTALGTRERPDPVRLNLKRFGFFDIYLRPLFVRAPVLARR